MKLIIFVIVLGLHLSSLQLIHLLEGGKLLLWMKGDKLMIKDEKGGTATVTIKDVYQSNGVIHVIDTVVLPQS